MKRLIVAMMCAALAAGAAFAKQGTQSTTPGAKPAQKPAEIKLKKEEFDAMKAVESAVGPDATIAAAKDFIAKYPTSQALGNIENDVYNAIVKAPRDAKLPDYAA